MIGEVVSAFVLGLGILAVSLVAGVAVEQHTPEGKDASARAGGAFCATLLVLLTAAIVLV